MPDRITLSRAKGWRMPPNAIVVARGPGRIWGNPWAVPGLLHTRVQGAGEAWRLPASMTAQATVDQFRDWLHHGQIAIDTRHWPDNLSPTGRTVLADHLHGRRQLIHANLHQLRGKALACWCKPGCCCHADVLLEIANV